MMWASVAAARLHYVSWCLIILLGAFRMVWAVVVIQRVTLAACSRCALATVHDVGI
jgi:hypothetical protein